METLDTDEATYVWHVSKDIAALKDALKTIDQHLHKIKNEGRQEFLNQIPKASVVFFTIIPMKKRVLSLEMCIGRKVGLKNVYQGFNIEASQK